MKSSIIVLLVPLSLLVAADAKPTGTTDGSKCPNDDCETMEYTFIRQGSVDYQPVVDTVEYTDSEYEDGNRGYAATKFSTQRSTTDGSKCPNPNDCPTIEYTDSDNEDENQGHAARDGGKCPNDDCPTIEYTDSDYEDVNFGHAARDPPPCGGDPICDFYNNYEYEY